MSIDQAVTEQATITLAEVFGRDGYIAMNKPGYEVRQAQVDVARLTERAIAEERNAIIEAGTGTGKSFAVVVPAVLSGKRTVISTETNTLLDQYVLKDLPFLQAILPKPFKFAKAKGKNNFLCRQKLDEYLSQPLLSPYADPAEVSALVDWAHETESGDRSEPSFPFSNASWETFGCDDLCDKKGCRYYVQGAKGHSDCFAYIARRAFLEAQIVVTNHTLCLLNAQLNSEGKQDLILGEHSVAIFDEAHTLAEQAQSTFGYEIKQRTYSSWIRYALKACHKAGIELPDFDATLMKQPEEWFFDQFRPLTKQQMAFEELPNLIRGEAQRASEPILRILDILRTALNSVMPNTEEDKKLLLELDGRTRQHMKGLGGLFEPQENWLPFAEVTSSYSDLQDRRVTLHYKPVDVAPLLQSAVYAWRLSTILTSATMTVGGRFDFPVRELGLEEPLCMQVGSPFDYATQCEGYFPTHLPDPNHPAYHTALADQIERILVHSNGRAFVLFTSYRDLGRVFDLVSNRLKFNIYRQGDLPKPALIERFKEDVHSVLFATRSFFTGVDIPGEALSCVILVKAPFRPPDEPLFKAKCTQIKRRGGNDFRDYALPLMVNDLRQAFGRLIRNRTDTGLFAFLDSRAINKPYFWVIQNSLPSMKVREEI